MAFTFNGTNSYLSSGVSVLGSSPNAFTISAFIKCAPQDNRFIVALGNSSDNNPVIGMSTGQSGFGPIDSMRLFIRNNSGAFLVGNSFDSHGGIIADNMWKHGVFRFADSTAIGYVDAQEVINKSGTMGNVSLNRTSIGALLRGSPALYLNGDIAEVGIWNAALTAAEIASLSKGMTCDKIRPQNLVFYAPLVRDLIDAKGGLTITNNNGATVANHPRVYA